MTVANVDKSFNVAWLPLQVTNCQFRSPANWRGLPALVNLHRGSEGQECGEDGTGRREDQGRERDSISTRDPCQYPNSLDSLDLLIQIHEEFGASSEGTCAGLVPRYSLTQLGIHQS